MEKIKIIFCISIFFISILCTPILRSQTSFYASLGNFAELDYKNSFLTTADIGILHENSHFFFIGIGTNVYKFWGANYSSIGIGLRPMIGYSFFKRDNYKILLQAKGGIIFMFPEYPNNTVNYDISIGPGIEFTTNENRKFRIGIHYDHFSNAKARGNVRNPTWDGFGIDLTLISKQKFRNK